MNILQLDANNFNQDLTISIKEDEKNVKIDYKQGTGCVVSLSNENREQGIGCAVIVGLKQYGQAPGDKDTADPQFQFVG